MKQIFLLLQKYAKNEKEVHLIKEKIKSIIFLHTRSTVELKDIYIKKNSLYIETSSLKKTKIFQKREKILEDFKKNKIEIYSLT